MLAALGPRLQRLSMRGLDEDLEPDYQCDRDLVPTILTHCPLLVHLEVENLLSSTAADKVFMYPSAFWHMHLSHAPHASHALHIGRCLQRWRQLQASNLQCILPAAAILLQELLGSAPLTRCSELHLCRWEPHEVGWCQQNIRCPPLCTAVCTSLPPATYLHAFVCVHVDIGFCNSACGLCIIETLPLMHDHFPALMISICVQEPTMALSRVQSLRRLRIATGYLQGKSRLDALVSVTQGMYRNKHETWLLSLSSSC
jgi:hypothetical protein